MRIIISPAKQMREDRDTLPPRGLPGFLPETGRLLTALRNLSPAELQKLWKCSDAIAALNVFLQEHLRILSGFYGLLRPFDGVTPYRLEMGARLAVDGCRDLYGFWGGKLARALAGESGWVLDLASKEYSRAVLPHLPPSLRVVTCVFGELRPDSKVVEKGTLCIMARGEMVRWLAETGTTHPDGLPAFQGLGYRFDPDRSTGARMVFLKTTQSSAV